MDWFAAAPDAGLPPDGVIARARAAVDWRRIRLEPDTIRTGEDQRLTLNGLGQGYVTDRVADLLHAQGLRACAGRSRRAARDRAAPGRRAMAGRPRQCRAVRTDRRRARDVRRRGLRARRSRRGASSVRSAHRPQRRTLEDKSPCTIAPRPSPTRCRRHSMPPRPTKSRPCCRALRER